MYGIFVNENGGIHYAHAIVKSYKPIETRNRNMLSACVGHRVAIVRTRRGKNPVIVGYADIVRAERKSCQWLDDNRNLTLIPSGSAYDCKPNGAKWCYYLENAVECDPLPLPENTIRHGRSFCEF